MRLLGLACAGPFTIQDRCGSKRTCSTPARASWRDPIERDNLLGVPATLVTLMIAAQGVTPTPSSATPRRRSLPRSLVTKLGPLELPHQTIWYVLLPLALHFGQRNFWRASWVVASGPSTRWINKWGWSLVRCSVGMVVNASKRIILSIMPTSLLLGQ